MDNFSMHRFAIYRKSAFTVFQIVLVIADQQTVRGFVFLDDGEAELGFVEHVVVVVIVDTGNFTDHHITAFFCVEFVEHILAEGDTFTGFKNQFAAGGDNQFFAIPHQFNGGIIKFESLDISI